MSKSMANYHWPVYLVYLVYQHQHELLHVNNTMDVDGWIFDATIEIATSISFAVDGSPFMSGVRTVYI